MRRLIAALAAALFLAAPIAARAQIAPTYADPAPAGDVDAQIHGRILTFDGAYNVQVRDEKGYVDNIQLHQGTVINPTGLTLAPGMIVSVMGYNAGSFFAANEIDTPYQAYGGSWYYSGHPWNYYGPSVSLGFFFGNGGWWHGGAFVGGPVRYYGGVRYYNNVHVNAVYRGGTYYGHSYVAPPARGGYYAGRPGPQGGYHPGYGGRPAPQGYRGGGAGGGDHHDHH